MPIPIHIPKQDLWDETRSEFIPIKEHDLLLEHSLVSLTKWERKWRKPFLSPEEKTPEQVMDYVRCMIIDDSDVEEEIINAFTPKDIKEIEAYIATDQTATTFPKEESSEPQSNELMTSELIYYYLATMQAPFETVEQWPLSNTLTLIRVASFKQKPEKKLNKREALAQAENINERNKRLIEEMKRKKGLK